MLKFLMSDKFKGTGASQGLDRGLLVYDGDELIVGEGLGMGACALQSGGFTFFTSIISIDDSTAHSITVSSDIDIKLVWKLLGIKSLIFTRIIESVCNNFYKKQEKRQDTLLNLAEILKKIFNAKSSFVKIPSQGNIKINYKICEDEAISASENCEIAVDLFCETIKSGFRLFVMNELEGRLFNRGLIDGAISPPPSGWQQIDGQRCELYSPDRKLAFSMTENKSPGNIPGNISSKLFWGREVCGDCNWAGFENEITCNGKSFANYRFSINFREVSE